MITSKGLRNPLALATATTALNSKQGQQAVGQTVNAVKLLVVALGLYLAGKWSWQQFKKFRAKQYANKNIGHPDLIAASTIASSFKRFGFEKSSVLSYILPQITVSTDEATLYDLASKITNIKAVSDAYNVLFDRSLQQDLQNDLSNTEAQKFWRILNADAINTDTYMYGINLTLYSAIKGKETRVNKAIQVNGKWEGTNESYGNFKTGEPIGIVIANGVFTDDKGKAENYYIVQRNGFGNWNPLDNWDTGVVLQHQVTEKK
mgnify:CR=1 FL=1